MPGRPHARMDHRRVRDRAAVLLIVGVALMLPPLAGLSLMDGTLLGVPIPLFYLFLVWIALIVGTARSARALWRTRHGGTPPTSADRPADTTGGQDT